MLEFKNNLLQFNFGAENCEALLWDIVANCISEWVDLLMDSSWWVTAYIQVRETDRRETFAGFDEAVHCMCDEVYMISNVCSVMGSSNSLVCPMWMLPLHFNKALLGNTLTPSH